MEGKARCRERGCGGGRGIITPAVYSHELLIDSDLFLLEVLSMFTLEEVSD